MKKYFDRYKPHYRPNLKLAIPVVISQAGHIVVAASDSIIVGHFAGTIALAAVSLVNSMFMVIMMIGIGISYGITPLIAQFNGQKNYAECGRLLSNSLLINCCCGILLFLLIYFGAEGIIGHLGQVPQVVEQAKPFLFLLGLSIVPLLIFNTFKQFAEGLGFTKQAMYISVWGNIVNIVLGIIFVKGMFGIQPMGVRGVGYSSLIDRSLMAIVMSAYVLRSPKFRAYLKDFIVASISKSRIASIFKIGAPVAMQYTFEISAFSGAAIIIGTMGAVPQAAHQIALNMAAMTYMMASGVAAAAAIKSGNYFGAKQFNELRASAIANYHIVLIFMSVTALIFTVFHQWLPWIYTSDRAVIVIASQLLVIAAVFQLFDGAQVIGLGVLRGMGDVNMPTFITFLAYWVVGIPLGYLLGLYFKLGVIGVWYGLVFGLFTAALMLYLRFKKMSKYHQALAEIVSLNSN